MKYRICLWVSLFLMSMGVACGESEVDYPLFPAGEILAQSTTAMQNAQTFHYLIERNGAPAFLDPDETIAFRRAEGDFLAPDKTQAVVRIIAPGFVTDIGVIGIGPIQWQTNVATGLWEELPPNWGFNPAVLFDPELGLAAIMAQDLSGLTEPALETLPDAEDNAVYYTFMGQIAGETLFAMSDGLLSDQSKKVTVWIAPDTFHLRRALLAEPANGVDEPTTWQVDLTQYDQPVTVTPPEIE